MKILALDGSASLCAACVFDTESGLELGRSVLKLEKGHAEHLMSVVAEALLAARTPYAELGTIAVATGPGSFTGLRVSIAAARGFALALAIPAVGVASLDAIAAEARASFPGRAVLSSLDAGRDSLYLAVHDEHGAYLEEPVVTTLASAVALFEQYRPVLAGSMAPRIAEWMAVPDARVGLTGATADIAAYARLAGRGRHGAPKPQYMRAAAAAKPKAGFLLSESG